MVRRKVLKKSWNLMLPPLQLRYTAENGDNLLTDHCSTIFLFSKYKLFMTYFIHLTWRTARITICGKDKIIQKSG